MLGKSLSSKIINIMFIVGIAMVMFSPTSKAIVIKGLLSVGLFTPKTTVESVRPALKTNVTFKREDGSTVTLEELKGKVVFINFWATWCPPCVAEMPAINKLYLANKANKDIEFILVDVDANFKKADDFKKAREFSFPLHQMASSVTDQIFTGTLPTTVVLDKFGRLAFKHEGLANYNSKKFKAFLETLIKQEK